MPPTPRRAPRPARPPAPAPSGPVALAIQDLSTLQWAILVALLVLPGTALVRFASSLGLLWPVLGGAVFISVLTYAFLAGDKRKARRDVWRTSESTLHSLEMLGGWPGSYIAQRRYRHKISKSSYQVTFRFIVAAYQIVAYDYLQGWKLFRYLLAQLP